MKIRNSGLTSALALACLFSPVALHATLHNGTLSGPVRLVTPSHDASVGLALRDLAGDFERSFGKRAEILSGNNGDIQLRIDPAMHVPESWTIRITQSRVQIDAADELGAIYGIYEFSRRFLGVDPLWYWKEQQLPHRASLSLAPQTLHLKPPAIRFRGWFINDEDLLCQWKQSSGIRGIGSPYYEKIMSLDVADRIFESLLRSGGNLVIPGSFINIMNPPEAALVQRAVERGLYVTQHHIEPLGVSYVSFAKYWKEHGETAQFSYGTNPEKVRETWRIYAAKWHEIAGNHVIWQLGLRGNGDRPVWVSDANVTQAGAGAVISRAIADQWSIVHSIDPRPQPPATVTLWYEGSQLMEKKQLTIPHGVTLVFSDAGGSQMLQPDFYKTPRVPNYSYGVYYHLAFWSSGPHMVQGTQPARMKPNFDAVLAHGDTQYAIINVSNIRPFTIGIGAVMQIMQKGSNWKEEDYFSSIATTELRQLYREFLDAYVTLPNGDLLQDGTCYVLIKKLLSEQDSKQYGSEAWDASINLGDRAKLAQAIDNSVLRLNNVVRGYPPVGRVPAEWRPLYAYNLRNQAAMLARYYGAACALLKPGDDSTRLHSAETELQQLLEIRKEGASGQWENWYRGDTKEDIPALLEKIQHDRESLHPHS